MVSSLRLQFLNVESVTVFNRLRRSSWHVSGLHEVDTSRICTSMMVCPLLVFLSIPALILAGTTDASLSAASAAAFFPRRHGSDMAATNARSKKKKNPSPSQSIAGLSPFTKKQDRSASSTPIAKDGEKPRSTIRRFLWSRICLSYRELKIREFLYAEAIILGIVIVVMLAGTAFVTDLCKLSDIGDLPSTLRCAFEFTIKGAMEVLEFIWPAVPITFLLCLIQTLLMDGIYGTKYNDAKISRPEEKKNEKLSKKGE